MKIYGGHDYYDCVLGYGADPAVVLIRKNEKLPPKQAPIPDLLQLQLREPGRYFSPERLKHITIVFCSKVYHGVEVGGHYFWSADKLRAWVAGHKGYKIVVNGPWQWMKKKPLQLEDYFATKEAPQNLRDYMITNRYAILLKEEGQWSDESEVVMNPHSLKRLDFAKALDPYTAYQELSMWVGGVLAGESPKTVKITSDRVLLEGHGFDNVFSFRGPRIK